MKRAGLIVLLLVLAGAGAYGYTRLNGAKTGGISLETAPAEIGDVRRLVSTSGKVRALVTVEVSSQLSGQIFQVTADYNSEVKQGDVIARLDPKTFETRVSEAEATVAVAEAGVAVSAAQIERARAALVQAEQDFRRAEALVARGNMSSASYDDARARLATARAELSVAEAQHTNARATLRQRQASLQSARIDLERTNLRTPIDGVVIDRAVDVGQIVAASLSAPVLFTIAQDLHEVQIDAQVDEADIGQVEEGQSVRFTVDAYPDQRFEGRVQQVRLAGVEEQNVVTYTVVISSDNPRRQLLPGMTANVDIVTGERAGVLTVPNGALRFRPRGAAQALVRQRDDDQGGPIARLLERLAPALAMTPEQVEQAKAAVQAIGGELDAEARAQRFRQALAGVLTAEQQAKYDSIRARFAQVRYGTVWIQAPDGKLEPRRVKLGISDSKTTEVEAERLKAGDVVVLRAREVTS